MGVNWLTVLNVGVWIKRTERGKRGRFTWKLGSRLFIFIFVVFTSQVSLCMILFYQLIWFLSRWAVIPWNIKHLDLPSFILSSLSPPSLLFFSPSAVSLLSYPIFCRLPGFIPQQWGWKLHFSRNVSCCKAPAGVIFFLQRWKHQAAFAALHVCKSERWCTPSEAS